MWRRAAALHCPGVDDPDLDGTTVAEVLADPAAFEGETLADPLEGIEYGRCKACVMRRSDGTPWIHSFAHGRTTYELKLDAGAIRAAMAAADADDVVQTFVRHALQADVDPTEEEGLIGFAKERSGSGILSIKRTLKKARQVHNKEKVEEERQRRVAERNDPRPMLPVPEPDAPWLPEMGAYNDVLAKSEDHIPPTRSIDGDLACIRKMEIPGT